MIKVSDYIAQRLVDHGVKDVFMISGGGAMHLNNSIGKNSKLNYICNQHEQASAIGAEGYSRVSGDLAVVCVTTGPGGTNTMTGVIGQWLDSIPVLYISGQVKYETCADSCKEIGLRQLGDQEINIVDIVKSVTKYAEMLKDPLDVKKVMDKAIAIATSGRPGPVWIDVPLNVQAALIDESKLNSFEADNELLFPDEIEAGAKLNQVVGLLKKSKRPVFIAGHGIRLSKGKMDFLNLIDKLGIPVVTTFNGFDLIESTHTQYIGRIGTVGDRAGNFALQNADLILCVGSRNNIRQVSYNWENYGKNAKKIIVDIDEKELNKPTIVPDLGINMDAKDFMIALYNRISKENLPSWSKWLDWNIERKNKYKVVLDEYSELENFVQPYYFINQLSKKLGDDEIVINGNGTACVAYFQAGIVKKNQRVFWNSGCASMGYDLPAAIGACIANNKKQVVCLAGDGSLQMNIQELETVAYYNLPIKLFVLNNYGYISIRQTHDNFFGGLHVACDPESGVGMPNFIEVAKAYGLKTVVIKNHGELNEKISEVLNYDGGVLCQVNLAKDYIFSPKLSSEKLPDGTMISKPLEDMYPFLDRKEFESNIIPLE